MPLPIVQGSFCFSCFTMMVLESQIYISHVSFPRHVDNKACDVGGVTPTGRLEQAIFRAYTAH